MPDRVMDSQWRLKWEDVCEGQQHEGWRTGSAAGEKLAAMCKVTCILVFSLNHAAKSSILLLTFGSYRSGELELRHQVSCCPAQKDVDIARKVR
jgi:hypothetical protein